MWQVANCVAYGLNVLVTYAVGSNGNAMLGAKSNREMSQLYPTLVTPQGKAFAIWGPIFLLEGASVVWQLMYVNKTHKAYAVLEAASPFWISTCAFIIIIIMYSSTYDVNSPLS